MIGKSPSTPAFHLRPCGCYTHHKQGPKGCVKTSHRHTHTRPSRGPSPGRREACGDPGTGPRGPGPAAAVPLLVCRSSQRPAPARRGRGSPAAPASPRPRAAAAGPGGPAALPPRPRSPGFGRAPPPGARQPRPPAERPRPPPHLGSGGRRRGRR